ncbi:hypothetical protein [Ferrimonas balearica]|uniref:hypothetical protein n=1 Tax=Ferrimonas balearica TaxID=44012 RepID=UPI001C9999DB|nr:hypothetical protein [Ferrimonas balearica]MBY5990500.1 hypothetical protein [Ferrimonas balearica]
MQTIKVSILHFTSQKSEEGQKRRIALSAIQHLPSIRFTTALKESQRAQKEQTELISIGGFLNRLPQLLLLYQALAIQFTGFQLRPPIFPSADRLLRKLTNPTTNRVGTHPKMLSSLP